MLPTAHTTACNVLQVFPSRPAGTTELNVLSKRHGVESDDVGLLARIQHLSELCFGLSVCTLTRSECSNIAHTAIV